MQLKPPPETSPKTFRGDRVNQATNQGTILGTNPEIKGNITRILDHLGSSLGTNPEIRGTNTRTLDHLGSSLGTSITLGTLTEIILEVIKGTLGINQEGEVEVITVRKMTIENIRGVITQKNTELPKETSPETTREVTTPETTQGKTQGHGIGTHLEIDMRGEDRERGARALETIEIEVMITGIGMPAMGADAEVVARSP